MTVDIERQAIRSAAADHSLTTPAGLDAIATLNARRLAVLILNVVTCGLLLFWTISILRTGGWTVLDTIITACIALGAPWPVLGFWNAVIGLWQLHVARSSAAAFAPWLAAAKTVVPLRVNTAVVMTLRNEDPRRALLRLQVMKASLDASGNGERFSYFILSDSDREDVARREEAAVAAWRSRDANASRIIYRRRTSNSGFKAGNLRDFALRWGRGFEFMLPLDADSLLTGPAVIGLVRIMQANPRLGILQSLVVGAPARSPFARIFQFGMRLGMRTYTMGQAWWSGDCGPYWGHNALVRIEPYVEACELPALRGNPPLGGPILSHDQVEAVLMRRAGFEVRVLPIETGSYEENPPDALAFMHRDLRWCQGNLQYVRLSGLGGAELVSRFQLFWAILMFLSVPAWTLLIAALPLAVAAVQDINAFPAHSAQTLYITLLLMHFAPKIAGVVDAMLTPGEIGRFGGGWRFALAVALENFFSFLLGAVSTLSVSLFMLGLPFGKSVSWNGRQRDGEGVTWSAALRVLWPHLLFGASLCGTLAIVSSSALIWSLPLTAGYLLAAPFAVLTADPKLGAFMRRFGIAAIPEDFAPPPEMRTVASGARS